MSVKVAVRVRPFNQREKFLGCLNCIQMKDKTTILINPRDRSQKQHQFTFDYSFWSHDGYEELENGYLYPIDDRFVDQKKIFKELGEDILKNAWNGFNCCLFAYGQTGAGKSYSMIGYESNRGIVPMACEKIFEGIERTRVKGKKQFQVTISMLEIYNEKVQDLFVHTSKRPPNGLKIRESKKVGVYVEGINRYQVHSYAQIQRRMQEGAKNRSLASTLMNEYSSRAHTIVMIEFIQKEFITEQKMNKKSSLLNLVDLAGSERVAKTGISDKDRLKQASQINKSLHTLGRVIEHLAELASGKTKNVQVPYRQSALTRILQTALGGNSMTTMICAISPANDNYQQTLSTLRYADQTKRIKNKPIINESAVDKIIRQLRQQNERLKEMLRIAKLKGINLQEEDGNIFANIQEIQREIRKNMQSFAINTDGMEEQYDDNVMISEFIDIPDPNDFYSGELNTSNITTTTIGNARANAFITNLSEDRLLSFKIKYSCQQQLYVGNKNLKQGGRNKLILCGLGVQDRHARLYQMNGKYFIEPLCQQSYQYTLVNGKPVDKRTQIFHNDRIIFGTNSVFLFKNFNQKGKKTSTQGVHSGFGSEGDLKSPNRIKSDTGVGIGTEDSKNMKISKKTSEGIGVGTDDDLNESLLLDDQNSTGKTDKIVKKSSSKSLQIQTDPYGEDSIDQKLIDYEFAINERQVKMFDTSISTHSSNSNPMSIGLNNDIANKLSEIEREFQELKAENERKMKEKEDQFLAELKRIQIEKQVQKAKLKQQLKVKQQEAKKIATQKERIQKIRDKLLEIEKQRKQKQRMIRQSMLIGDDEDQHGNLGQNNFKQLPQPSQKEAYTKKKAGAAVGGVEINTDPIKPQIETKIQYIDRHHFTYDFNVIHNGGASSLPNEDYKSTDLNSVNTTSATNSTNTMVNPDESMLLDSQEFKKMKDIQEAINEIPKQKRSNRNLKFENVYNLNEIPPQTVKVQQNENAKKQTERKMSLNLTDILLDLPHDRRKGSTSNKSSEQENLLNTSKEQALANYIPSHIETGLKQGLENISLNLSQDMTNNFAIREEELLDKIRQYELKLKSLEEASKQKKQSIKNIRKSFAVEFGQNLNSENFYNEENLFEGQFDLSVIETKKEDLSEETEIERKKRFNIIQCQNENIINQRALQVRKRKRQAEQLKEAFIKKQKRELQKKLVQVIPMLEKFNLWAREMNRNLQGKIQVQYHNFTNYEIIDALKSSLQGKINIQIKIYNFEQGRTYKWPMEVFQNRFEIAESLFERFLQNPTSDIFSDKSKDPFWDPRDFQAHAIGYLSLQPLSYALDYEGEIALVYKGQTVGYLDVLLEPTIQRGASKLKEKLDIESPKVENQIYDPRQLLESDLCFTLSIQRFRPTEHLPVDKIQKYYISYEILEDNYKTQVYKTQQISINKQRIGYMLKHSMQNVTEHTLAYLADSPLCITLNLLFEYDHDMNSMTSSFYHHSDTSLNTSTMSEKILKSEAGNTSGESPPQAFAKKKATIIMQNPDVLTKIQEQFTSEQKKIMKKKAEQLSSQKRREKQKNKDECTVF